MPMTVRQMKTLFMNRFGPFDGIQWMPPDRAQLWRDLNKAGDQSIHRAGDVTDIDTIAFLSDDEAKTCELPSTKSYTSACANGTGNSPAPSDPRCPMGQCEFHCGLFHDGKHGDHKHASPTSDRNE